VTLESAIDTPSVEHPSWTARLIIVLYVTGLIGAQASATLFSTEVSVACDSVLLLALLNHFALAPASAEMRAALASVALVPLLRIEAVALPQQFIPSAYWEALPAALVLATVFGLRRVVDLGGQIRSRSHLSSERGWPAQLAMSLLGPPFALASAYALSALDLASARPGLVSTPAAVLLVAAFSGVMLEIVFRGVIQPALMALCGWHGVALTSLLYAGLFIGSASWFFVVLAFTTSVVWGSFSALTRSVRGVARSHGLFAMTWAALF
jgi:hypothetical protein